MGVFEETVEALGFGPYGDGSVEHPDVPPLSNARKRAIKKVQDNVIRRALEPEEVEDVATLA